ncbi:MAG: helix-hairpin-helix domain-containing protein, partial [Oleibacter sp.]|nr:helix-hairpin-helix domain-containing protein [Thalassolituus sp.]
IEPKSIGVGQYQHDVNQSQLARSLDAVVEDCVNSVGVDLNMASVPLLTRVSGLNTTLANNIVAFRDSHGAFKSRKDILKVPRLGDKTFEQAAGFLRIMNGSNPLDASAVHPESYPVVEAIAHRFSRDVASLVGDSALLKSVNAADFSSTGVGAITLKDIVTELEKPGRDPRPEFKFASFKDGVEEIKDLQPGMILEGVITNVAAFGAFVDVGVHQDGLVHISALSDTFVKDPRDVVKAGDIIKVKVMEIDISRKRIGLSMRLTDDPTNAVERGGSASGARNETRNGGAQRSRNNNARASTPEPNSAMAGALAAAFAKAKK